MRRHSSICFDSEHTHRQYEMFIHMPAASLVADASCTLCSSAHATPWRAQHKNRMSRTGLVIRGSQRQQHQATTATALQHVSSTRQHRNPRTNSYMTVRRPHAAPRRDRLLTTCAPQLYHGRVQLGQGSREWHTSLCGHRGRRQQQAALSAPASCARRGYKTRVAPNLCLHPQST